MPDTGYRNASHSQHALALWKVQTEEVGKRRGNVALEKSEQGDFAPEGPESFTSSSFALSLVCDYSAHN